MIALRIYEQVLFLFYRDIMKTMINIFILIEVVKTMEKKVENLLLDFSHTYPQGIEKNIENLKRIDLSDLSGTTMYCSPEAKQEIEKRLTHYVPHGIHFLDNGNYHYMTKIFTEKIHHSFSLVLFDHHNDMHQPLIHDLTSCGSWAAEMLQENAYLKQLILIGPSPKTIKEIPEDFQKKLVCISINEIEEDSAQKEIQKIDMSHPAYISIDKDVLDRYWARTNWDQGNMSIRTLEIILKEIFQNQKVIGVDICGECNLQEPLNQLIDDQMINHMTNDILYHFIEKYL